VSECNARCSKITRDTVSLDISNQANGASKCSLPRIRGHCRASFARYFYNSTAAKCEMFVYGGCGGNSNNFNSQSECESQCAGLGNYRDETASQVEINSNQKCTAPKATGPCFANLERFFFNTVSRQCESFAFGL
jgi:hypothetical protein